MVQGKYHRILVELEGVSPSEVEIRAFFAEHGTLHRVRVEEFPGAEHLQTAALAGQLGHEQEIQKMTQCAELVRRLHDPTLLADLNKLAASLGQKNPLEMPIVRLRRMIDPASVDTWWRVAGDEQRADVERVMKALRRARQLTTEKKNLLNRIHIFLVPIPEGEPYRRLKLAQDLVREHFRIDVLVAQPHLVEGALASAFSEFHRMYVQQYRREWQDFCGHVVALRKKETELIDRAHAVERLAEVPALALPEARGKRGRLCAFFSGLPEVLDVDVGRELEGGPTCGEFVLGMRPPVAELDKLQSIVENTLGQQLATLRGLVAEKILSDQNKNDGLQKLLDVLRLSQLDELVRLVIGPGGGRLVEELQKLTQHTK